jgi:flagellar biosynthesis chaperone FliJ
VVGYYPESTIHAQVNQVDQLRKTQDTGEKLWISKQKPVKMMSQLDQNLGRPVAIQETT